MGVKSYTTVTHPQNADGSKCQKEQVRSADVVEQPDALCDHLIDSRRIEDIHRLESTPLEVLDDVGATFCQMQLCPDASAGDVSDRNSRKIRMPWKQQQIVDVVAVAALGLHEDRVLGLAKKVGLLCLRRDIRDRQFGAILDAGDAVQRRLARTVEGAQATVRDAYREGLACFRLTRLRVQ